MNLRTSSISSDWWDYTCLPLNIVEEVARLTPRDLAALNAFESLDSGLYRRMFLTVEAGTGRARALIYVGRRRGKRTPMPGYQERLVAAAQDWQLPPFYIDELRRLAPGYRGARPAETGEIA